MVLLKIYILGRILLAVEAEAAKNPEAIFLCHHKTVQKDLATLANRPKIIDFFHLKYPPCMKNEVSDWYI